ncbi:MAG: glycoside hydrolase family 2 TIM barrel-domain containing protein [Aristaeellaceae bacterium]
MKRIAFNDGWSYRIWGVPGSTPVTLPHDHSLSLPRSAQARSGSAGGFFQCENIIYDRELTVTPELLAQRVVLEFEGIMANAQVYLDDVLIAKQFNGYTTFHADLTPYLREGVQKLRINTANDAQPCSRWYTGCGIYRPVWLLQGPKACIAPWGLYATTRCDAGVWQLTCEITLSEEACQPGASLRCRVTDTLGSCLAQTEAPVSGTTVTLAMPVPGVTAWSPETPALYRVTAELLLDGNPVDSESAAVGFRTVALDPERGLLLNGDAINLRGGCVHHDNGLLGAAGYADAEYRKARLLKENGFNAVRCAHNPPTPAFLDACDELGLVVMDEFTDVWNIGKNPYDYHLFFRECWRDDLRAMILRDRNHPSILLWSIGNEIPERDGSGQGYLLSRQLSDAVRALDSTRLLTAGLNNIGKRRVEMLEANLQSTAGDDFDYFGALSKDFLAPLDVAGYNYLGKRYERDLEQFPQRFICGTESVAGECFPYWQKVLTNPRVIGDFAWAAIDYLGESGIGHVWYRPEDGEGYFERFPWRQGNCADIDLCGRKRPCSYYRDAVWGRLDAPYIAVQHPCHFHEDGNVSYWAWPERFGAWDFAGYEGKPVQVDVYSAAPRVTLLLNGQAVGEAPCEACKASFDLTYTPGVLEAVDSLGHHSLLRTPGESRKLVLTADRTAWRGEGNLIWITAAITGENGAECVFDARSIRFEAEGAALLAVGSADPASEEGFCTEEARAWNGCVCAVLQAGKANKITVTAHAKGLPAARLVLTLGTPSV